MLRAQNMSYFDLQCCIWQLQIILHRLCTLCSWQWWTDFVVVFLLLKSSQNMVTINCCEVLCAAHSLWQTPSSSRIEVSGFFLIKAWLKYIYITVIKKRQYLKLFSIQQPVHSVHIMFINKHVNRKFGETLPVLY